MIVYFTIIEILALFFFIYYNYKGKGLLTLVDQGSFMLILWLSAVILYNFRLSNLYNPDMIINILVIILCLIIFVVTRYVGLSKGDIKSLLDKFKEPNWDKYYSIFSTILFIIGLIAFLITIKQYGLIILKKNKINKQQISHYTTYLVFLLIICGQIKYILFRQKKKIMDLLIFICSILILLATLNRGPIMFTFSTVVIYEIFNVSMKHEMFSKKIKAVSYSILTAAIVLFTTLFGYIGNLRVDFIMKHVYKHSISQHFGISPYIPSGLMWIYMYLTSPLENAAFAIQHQMIDNTLFSNLLYPFIKIGADICGKGTVYKNWLSTKQGYMSYLDAKAGLNVSSFITDAFQDMGSIAFLVYILVFAIVIISSIKIISDKCKFTSLGKIIIYSNAFNIIAWSIFVNPFRLANVIINIGIIVLFEIFIIQKSFIRNIIKK